MKIDSSQINFNGRRVMGRLLIADRIGGYRSYGPDCCYDGIHFYQDTGPMDRWVSGLPTFYRDVAPN
jgi:hypothetical protein